MSFIKKGTEKYNKRCMEKTQCHKSDSHFFIWNTLILFRLNELMDKKFVMHLFFSHIKLIKYKYNREKKIVESELIQRNNDCQCFMQLILNFKLHNLSLFRAEKDMSTFFLWKWAKTKI